MKKAAILIMAGGAIFIFGIWIGRHKGTAQNGWVSENNKEGQIVLNISKQTPVNSRCYLGGKANDAKYVGKAYIIKPGDSIEQIARKELGDINRANEIIYLNKGKYPTLSSQTSFLEIGWELNLPPREIKLDTEANIGIIQGQLIYKSKTMWGIRTSPEKGQFTAIYPIESTKYLANSQWANEENIILQECVKATVESSPTKTNRPVLIETY